MFSSPQTPPCRGGSAYLPEDKSFVLFVKFVVGRNKISVESVSSVFVGFMNTDCTDSPDFSVSIGLAFRVAVAGGYADPPLRYRTLNRRLSASIVGVSPWHGFQFGPFGPFFICTIHLFCLFLPRKKMSNDRASFRKNTYLCSNFFHTMPVAANNAHGAVGKPPRSRITGERGEEIHSIKVFANACFCLL